MASLHVEVKSEGFSWFPMGGQLGALEVMFNGKSHYSSLLAGVDGSSSPTKM